MKNKDILNAGFSKVNITPPIGTPMTGYGHRDFDTDGCKGIHDELYVRALYLEQGKDKILIMGFDLLFFSREEADRYKGAIGRSVGLSPEQILLNTSHTHTGPKVGSWLYSQSDTLYLNELELAIIEAANKAKGNIEEVTLWAGTARSDLPMSRRLLNDLGIAQWAVNPDGTVYDKIPFVLLKNKNDKPFSLLFSASCHPSTVSGDSREFYISSDYPGVAMKQLDEYLGVEGSLFLQGVGGDTKASVLGKGREGMEEWKQGTWDDVKDAGSLVSDAIKKNIDKGLVQIEPDLQTYTIEMDWELKTPLSRDEYKKIYDTKITPEGRIDINVDIWAKDMIEHIDRNFKLLSTVPITTHAVQLGYGVRMVSLEGEAVAEFGHIIEKFYNGGVTFPLGYTDGCQMYLPTTEMLPEAGYEVDSYWEYRKPTPFAGGHEKILYKAMKEFSNKGIK